jgi:glutamate-1-semialdehyde 2,1-aminomutase
MVGRLSERLIVSINARNMNAATETIIRLFCESRSSGEHFKMVGDYVSRTPNSRALYERAKRFLPEGVSYAIRYFEPYPFYVARAKGSKLYDVDENEYVDFWLGHTALILGHAHPAVIQAVKKQLENGTHYGTCHELEIKLAEQVAKMVPSAEMIRFTNSGTEANMYAARLARAFTGRSKIAKFEGGWHGGYDALHVGVKYPFDVPESAGLTDGATRDTIVLPFNDLEGVRDKLKGEQVAAIVVEPVLGAGGGVPAEQGFLKGLREFCEEKKILLIFDEVITGFRLAPGGGQQHYTVKPDLTVLGKIVGGGFPIGALCGRTEIMERLDTLIYKRPQCSFHGGTFTANPITMIAGTTTLELLEDGKLISKLNKTGQKIREKMQDIFGRHGIDVQITGVSSIFNTHFTKEPIKDAYGVFKADRKKLIDYDLVLISNGIFFLPTHTGVISTAHSEADLERLYAETEKYAKSHGAR